MNQLKTALTLLTLWHTAIIENRTFWMPTRNPHQPLHKWAQLPYHHAAQQKRRHLKTPRKSNQKWPTHLYRYTTNLKGENTP